MIKFPLKHKKKSGENENKDKLENKESKEKN